MISKILLLGNATPLPHPLRVTLRTSVASLITRTTCTPAHVHVPSITPGLVTRMEINANACPGWMPLIEMVENHPIWNDFFFCLFVCLCSKFLSNVDSLCFRNQTPNWDVKRSICFQFSIETIMKELYYGRHWNLNYHDCLAFIQNLSKYFLDLCTTKAVRCETYCYDNIDVKLLEIVLVIYNVQLPVDGVLNSSNACSYYVFEMQ